ncbi:hypothetical protein LguiA_015981 [Lonicera macranthoides]
MYVYSLSIILLTQLDVRRLSLTGKLCFRGGVETTITAAMKKVNRGPLVTSGLTFTSSLPHFHGCNKSIYKTRKCY